MSANKVNGKSFDKSALGLRLSDSDKTRRLYMA